jgi:anti-sigma factor RsiW
MRRLPLRRRRHPAPTDLSRYLDGELRREERRLLEDHLLRCERCRALLKSLAQTLQALTSLPRPEAPGLAEGIIAELRAGAAPAPAVHAAPSSSLRRAGNRVRARVRLAVPAKWLGARLRLTVPLALLVGAVLTMVNQGGMLFAGRIDLRMCAICGLNFVLPFLALNLALFFTARTRIGRR